MIKKELHASVLINVQMFKLPMGSLNAKGNPTFY